MMPRWDYIPRQSPLWPTSSGPDDCGGFSSVPFRFPQLADSFQSLKYLQHSWIVLGPTKCHQLQNTHICPASPRAKYPPLKCRNEMHILVRLDAIYPPPAVRKAAHITWEGHQKWWQQQVNSLPEYNSKLQLPFVNIYCPAEFFWNYNKTSDFIVNRP